VLQRLAVASADAVEILEGWPSVLAYHRRHGVAEPVSWATLADLGRRLSIDRQAELGGRLTTLQWLSLHVRGAIYELGRLQSQRGRSRLEGLAGNPLRRGECALALAGAGRRP
jgi:hypothetical protein